MNDPNDEYDRDHSFKPYYIELRGSCEIKIYLTDSEIKEIEEKDYEDSEGSLYLSDEG